MAIPMVFEDAPAAFDRVVLGGVRRVVGQAYGQPGLLDEFDPAGHELGSTAVALGAVVEVEEPRIHLRKAVPLATPEGLKAVCQAIAGHLCRHGEEMKFVMLRQKNADRSYLRVGLKIVIQCLGRHPTDAVAGEFAPLDGGLGVHRQPQYGLIRVSLGVDFAQALEEGVGFCYLFLGRVLATVWG